MKILFWLNKSRKMLYCRITVCGVRAEISTGIRIFSPSLWDSVHQRVKLPSDVHLTEMKLFFQKFEIINSSFTAESAKQAWQKRNINKMGKPSPRLQSIIPKGTGYSGLLKHLKSFKDDPRLDEITQEWADKFAKHLEGNIQLSSAKLYIVKIRSALTKAINNYPKSAEYPGMIDKIPFKGPDVCTQHTNQEDRPKYLNLNQYEALKSLKLDGKDVFYLNCFLWQCATGQSFIDMKNFTGNCIFQDVTGEKYIKYHRQKTFIEAIIPIGTEILTVMHDIDDWQPVRSLTERTYNRALRRISEQISFKRMTSHVGRHTFGVLRLIDGYTMESVAKMLGHASIRVTEKVYARVTIDKIFKEKRQMQGKN